MPLSQTSKPCCKSVVLINWFSLLHSTSSLPFLSHLLFAAWYPCTIPLALVKKVDKAVHTKTQGLIRFKVFSFLWCLHFLQGWRHLKPEERLSSCGISVISQQMQEVLFPAWGPSRKPAVTLNAPLPAPCYIRPLRTSHQSYVFGWLDWLRAASMSVEVCAWSRCLMRRSVMHAVQAFCFSDGKDRYWSIVNKFMVKLELFSWLKPASCPPIAWVMCPNRSLHLKSIVCLWKLRFHIVNVLRQGRTITPCPLK